MTSYEHIFKQKRLRRVLCCPTCRGDIQEVDLAQVNGFVVSANLLCVRCGLVGHVCNGRYVFGKNPLVRYGRSFTSEAFFGLTSTSLEALHGLTTGNWRLQDDLIWTDEAGAFFVLETDAFGVNFDLLVHSWAGKVEITINENVVTLIDLFEPNGSSRISIPIFLGRGTHRVRVLVTGEKDPSSHASQCHLLGLQELKETHLPTDLESVLTGNRGNPYPLVWSNILALASNDAMILDCGSGDRCYPDDRILNFEYCAFGLPDVFGDGHSIPFKDNSFDVVLSQAVIEHLYDPKKAANEIERILKPGGLVYVESAFMQPLHAVPFHFFNTTPWGLEKLFENLDCDEVECHGTLGQTLQWIYSLCDLESRGGAEKLNQLLQLSADLDRLITSAEMRKFASFVSLFARKKLLNSGPSDA